MSSKFRRASSGLNDRGFLLADSLLSLMIIIIITSILLPAMITLVQYDQVTKEQLEFNRQLYIAMNAYDDFDSFKVDNKRFVIRRGEICDKVKEELCIRFNR